MNPLVVIPTYNESESLPGILDRTRRAVPEAHVLIVDDDSPDGTGKLADHRADEDRHVHVLHRAGKNGLGAAYVAGFEWGLACRAPRFDVLIEMDADGSHRPEQIPDLLAALGRGADVALGSRWVRGGRVENWPWTRLVISRIGNAYTRIALGLALHDATGGFRAYRREVLEDIELSDVASQGYCFQVDLAWRSVRRGHRPVEVPIRFVERQLGSSKMTSEIVREALLRVTVWGARHRWEQLRGLLGR